MLYFLEIVCAASIAVCIANPNPNPPVPRYYKTKAECERALIVAASGWITPTGTRWRFNCLTIKQ